MGLEGVLDMTHAGRALAKEDPYNVEPHGFEGWLSNEEVVFGQGADLGLFARGDGLKRVSEAGPAAQLHLDEDECVGSNVQSTIASEFRFRALLAGAKPDVRFERA